MKILLESAVFTSCIFLFHAYLKTKKDFFYYVVVFLIFLFGSLMIDRLYAEDYHQEKFMTDRRMDDLFTEFPPEFLEEPDSSAVYSAYPDFSFTTRQLLSSTTRSKKDKDDNLIYVQCIPNYKEIFKQKTLYHRKKCQEAYNASKNAWDFLPKLDDREKARYLYEAAFSTVAVSDPTHKAIAALIVLCAKYGLDVIDGWHAAESRLYRAEYHGIMADFYYEAYKLEAEKPIYKH